MGTSRGFVTLSCGLFLAAGLLADRVSAQSPEEVAAVKSYMAEVQLLSFENNREYCGIVGYDMAGRIVMSKAKRGRRASCRLGRDPAGIEVVASYHTHGSFHEDYDSEVPSVNDVEGDMEDGLDGYVATPGGRLWFVDGQTGISRQLCGLGCLPDDPEFVPEYFGPVAQRYSLDALTDREEE